jgi:transcriptional regulator with XRE-family HTH domain
MEATPEDTESASAASRRGRRSVRQNGAAITALRKKDRKSQTAVARQVGIQQAGLSLIESEAVSARKSTLIRIARALDVPLGAITRDCEEAA